MDHFYMNFFHAFLKLTISLLKTNQRKLFCFYLSEKNKKILVKP